MERNWLGDLCRYTLFSGGNTVQYTVKNSHVRGAVFLRISAVINYEPLASDAYKIYQHYQFFVMNYSKNLESLVILSVVLWSKHSLNNTRNVFTKQN